MHRVALARAQVDACTQRIGTAAYTGEMRRGHFEETCACVGSAGVDEPSGETHDVVFRDRAGAEAGVESAEARSPRVEEGMGRRHPEVARIPSASLALGPAVGRIAAADSMHTPGSIAGRTCTAQAR